MIYVKKIDPFSLVREGCGEVINKNFVKKE